jgi:hypothetical protein
MMTPDSDGAKADKKNGFTTQIANLVHRRESQKVQVFGTMLGLRIQHSPGYAGFPNRSD